MARFDRVWSPTQRAAVARAVLEQGLKVAPVLELAREGQLAGLAPFDMPVSTAHDYVRKERQKRKRAEVRARALDADDPAEAARQLRRRTLALAEGMLARAEGELEGGRLDASTFRTTSAAVLDIAKRIEVEGARKGALPADSAAAETDLLDRLASGAVPPEGGDQNGSEAHHVPTQ